MRKSKYVFCVVLRDLIIVSAVLVAVLPNSVRAMSKMDDLAADQISVRELMRLDTEHALTLARERAGVKQPAASPAKRIPRSMVGEPRLNAIYGVGRNLMAEVVLDHVIYLYRKGQALPIGVAPGNDVYLLTRISSSCVNLERPDASHKLCMKASQWAGK